MSVRHVVGLVALAASAFAGTAQAKFMPNNHLYLEDRAVDGTTGITQDQFNKVIDRAVKYFTPIISAFGGNYVVQRLWDDATVNADSDQQGTTWNVNMYGGLARRAEITEDGFAMVLCHETGHHLGGFPYLSDWAADEGQADTFATGHCARVVFADEKDINAQAATTVNATAKAKCDASWTTDDDRNLCYRVMNASMSLANLLAALGGTGTVSYDTPDTSTVDTTNDDHPAAQCRLDTYVASAVCTAPYDQTVIAGKVSGVGQNDAAAETQSGKFFCEDAAKYGQNALRPRCWFKPSI